MNSTLMNSPVSVLMEDSRRLSLEAREKVKRVSSEACEAMGCDELLDYRQPSMPPM